MKITAIIVYPIKGMKGINVSSAETEERGLKYDRRYMLVNDKGTFISQRTHPILTQISPILEDESMLVKYRNKSLKIPLLQHSEKTIHTTVFEHSIQAHLVSNQADEWFSKILKDSVRLVKMTDTTLRRKELIKGPEYTLVSFADGYPYLFLGTKSFSILNAKLNSPIEINRFRPNIIVETSEPHEEDLLDKVKIGSADFQIIKPCARCPVITIDQETGLKNKETMKVLSTYRKIDNKVYFGTNAICSKNGTIHVGDSVINL